MSIHLYRYIYTDLYSISVQYKTPLKEKGKDIVIGKEGDDRGRGRWMASRTQWT